MSLKRKIALGKNVLEAAQERVQWIFDTFEQITLSFSGGKDSTALFHLVAAQARKQHRKFNVMFLDWEVQYSATIDHIIKMKSIYQDCIEQFYWIALPITTESGISQYEPTWTAWEPGKKWVRQPPEDAITDPHFFPFYHPNMLFEDFTPAFNQWITGNHRSSIILLGIRADESLNRFIAISNNRKLRYADDIPWTTASAEGFYYMAYPIYDWHVKDIWTYIARFNLPYNPIYDLMHQAGVSLSQMRICEPFGPEQRKGLWLYHVLEPETWSLACERVSGADAGMLYTNPRNKSGFYGRHQISKPSHHTWKSYAHFLLASLPEKTAEHYRNKIAVYLRWYAERDYPNGIPDAQEGDTSTKQIPSWRRICKTILRNDFWCRTLAF
uniref:phosphoadenosine phosphosulfate reductase n=3 Tax=Morganellaceae TaxID=1903414 RepID=UPI0010733E1A